MRNLRWLVYAPAALIAFFASPVAAQEYINWTCWADTSWPMRQPIEDYQAGLYPQWSDCEAWRFGEPAAGWQWSYGAGVATTTSVTTSSTVQSSPTSTVPAPDTTLPEASSTSTTEAPTTTVETTTTTIQLVPTTQQIPQTESWPEPTEAAPVPTEAPTTTEVATTTTASSVPAPTTSSPSEASTSVPVASETSTPTVATPPTFLSVESYPDATVLLPADEEEQQQFEEQVNIFNGAYDNYVPLGSKITVAERRTIIAASTILMTLPTPTASRRRT